MSKEHINRAAGLSTPAIYILTEGHGGVGVLRVGDHEFSGSISLDPACGAGISVISSPEVDIVVEGNGYYDESELTQYLSICSGRISQESTTGGIELR